MRIRSLLVCGTLMGFFFAAVGVQAAEQISLSKVPEKIKDDVKIRYPRAVITKAVQEPNEFIELTLQHKNATQEVVYKQGDGGNFKLAVSEISVNELPITVVNCLNKHRSGAQIKSAEKIVNAKDKVSAYTLIWYHKNQKKKLHRTHITPDGKVLHDSMGS